MIGNAFMYYFKKKEPIVRKVPRKPTQKDLTYRGRMSGEQGAMTDKDMAKMRRRMLAESMAEPEE